MSFFDKAKQAATDMAAKADQAMSSAGLSVPGVPVGGAQRQADAVLRDYGLITWREAHGHPVDATQKERVVTALVAMEHDGVLSAMRVGAPGVPPGAPPPLGTPPAPGTPPPPPGAAAAAAATRPDPPSPPPAPAGPTTDSPTETGHSGGGTAPPPPPPSWA